MTLIPRLENRPDRPANFDAFVAKAARREAYKWHIRSKARASSQDVSYDDAKLRLDHRRGRAEYQTIRVAPEQLHRFFLPNNMNPDEVSAVTQAFNNLAADDRELIAALAHLPDAPSIAAIARSRKRSRQSVHRSARRLAVMLRYDCVTSRTSLHKKG